MFDAQRLPFRAAGDELWRQRFASIRDHEEHLARNGTAVLKFFLHVSREEQLREMAAIRERLAGDQSAKEESG